MSGIGNDEEVLDVPQIYTCAEDDEDSALVAHRQHARIDTGALVSEGEDNAGLAHDLLWSHIQALESMDAMLKRVEGLSQRSWKLTNHYVRMWRTN